MFELPPPRWFVICCFWWQTQYRQCRKSSCMYRYIYIYEPLAFADLSNNSACNKTCSWKTKKNILTLDFQKFICVNLTCLAWCIQTYPTILMTRMPSGAFSPGSIVYFRRELASNIKHFSTHVEKHRNKKYQKTYLTLAPPLLRRTWFRNILKTNEVSMLFMGDLSDAWKSPKHLFLWWISSFSPSVLAYFVLATQTRSHFWAKKLPIQQCSSSQTISPRRGLVEKTHVSNIKIHY